jgi:hypothetical protein
VHTVRSDQCIASDFLHNLIIMKALLHKSESFWDNIKRNKQIAISAMSC